MKVSDLIEINGMLFPYERDMTPEEVDAYERERADDEARRRQEPPTDIERIEAQTLYTAVITDTLLEE